MVARRKQAVSLRLSTVDLKKIKRMSERLGVRDSEIIRFAIKILLARLSPLSDPVIKGRALVPLFLEAAPDILQNFDLDVTRLDQIINEGIDEPERVSPEDLHMIAMVGSARAVAYAASSDATPAAARHDAHDESNGHHNGGHERRSNTLQRYLYEKYLYRNGANGGDS